jgi:hypothetical protein
MEETIDLQASPRFWVTTKIKKKATNKLALTENKEEWGELGY